MRGKRFWITLMALAAVIASAALVALRRRAGAPQAPPAAQARPAPTEIVLPALIRAKHVVAIPAPVQGVVEEVLVQPGQEVYEGQLLGRIRNQGLDMEQQTAAGDLERAQARMSSVESQLIAARVEASRARADAARAQVEYDRVERAYLRQQMLQREGATPRLVYEKALKEYEAEKTERDSISGLTKSAEDRLDMLVRSLDAARRTVDEKSRELDAAKQASAAAEVRSPVTGFVAASSHHVGDEVTPEVQDLFQIASDISALEAVLAPDAATLQRVRPGQQAFIVMADAPDAIAAQISEIKGGEAIIAFASPSPALRPGMTAQVRLQLK